MRRADGTDKACDGGSRAGNGRKSVLDKPGEPLASRRRLHSWSLSLISSRVLARIRWRGASRLKMESDSGVSTWRPSADRLRVVSRPPHPKCRSPDWQTSLNGPLHDDDRSLWASAAGTRGSEVQTSSIVARTCDESQPTTQTKRVFVKSAGRLMREPKRGSAAAPVRLYRTWLSGRPRRAQEGWRAHQMRAEPGRRRCQSVASSHPRPRTPWGDKREG